MSNLANQIPDVSGNWSEDNRTGREWADRLITQMKLNDDPTLLGRTAKVLIEAGRYSGVEVGFFHHIAELARR